MQHVRETAETVRDEFHNMGAGLIGRRAYLRMGAKECQWAKVVFFGGRVFFLREGESCLSR